LTRDQVIMGKKFTLYLKGISSSWEKNIMAMGKHD
jgi:hypothetical protein